MNKIRALTSLFLLSFFLFACSSCDNEQLTSDVLTGTWKTASPELIDSVQTYSIIQFVEGQKGVTGVQTPDSYSWSRQFDYRIEGEQVVMTINYDSEVKSVVYAFKVDGDKLTLTDLYDENRKVVYIKE